MTKIKNIADKAITFACEAFDVFMSVFTFWL